MKKLLVDLDNVICTNTILDKVNQFFETNYTYDNFPSLNIEDAFEDKQKVENFFNTYAFENYYKKPYILPDCKKVLKYLSKYYEIFICTAYVWPEKPDNTKTELCSKIDFLYKTFNFINPKHIIFCSNKSVLNGDIIIDDCIHNLTGSSKIKLLFTTKYNKHISSAELNKQNITRVYSWQEIKNLLIIIK